MDHAVLEADRHEPVFVNVLSLEHSDYDISLSAPGKGYMEKVNIPAVGFKEMPITQKVLEIYDMRQRR